MPPLFKLILGIAMTSFVAGCATGPESDPTMKAMKRADTAYSKGEWETAEKHYRTVIAAVPKDAYAYMRLGNSLVRQSRLDEAANAYRESLVRDITEAKTYNNLAMVRLLQAEAALESTVKYANKDDLFAAHARRMLIQIKNITRISK